MIADVIESIKNLGSQVFGCSGHVFGDVSGGDEVFVVTASGYTATRTYLSGSQYNPNVSIDCYYRFSLNRDIDALVLNKIIKAVEFCDRCVYIPGVNQCSYTGLTLEGSGDICTLNFQINAMGGINEY